MAFKSKDKRRLINEYTILFMVFLTFAVPVILILKTFYENKGAEAISGYLWAIGSFIFLLVLMLVCASFADSNELEDEKLD